MSRAITTIRIPVLQFGLNFGDKVFHILNEFRGGLACLPVGFQAALKALTHRRP